MMNGLKLFNPVPLCMLLAAFSVPASAAEFGRLFFTPAQRAVLDNARRQNISVDVGKEESETVPQNISVNGLVRRSDGKTTVWLNNRAVTEQQSGSMGISSGGGNRVRIAVPDSGRIVDLKVGQTADVVNGAVHEGYERSAAPAIEATPSAPAAAPAPAATGTGK